MPHIVADPKESVAEHEDMGHLSHSVFPFLKLPRELRDQVGALTCFYIVNIKFPQTDRR